MNKHARQTLPLREKLPLHCRSSSSWFCSPQPLLLLPLVSSENSSLGEEAMHTTLPFKKASSPGRLDRELTPCSRARGGGVGTATDSLVRLARFTASCPREAAAAASCSARSASSSSCCMRRRRCLLRSVVSSARHAGDTREGFDGGLHYYSVCVPSIAVRVFPGFIPRPFRGVGVGFEEPHLRCMF